MRRQEPGASWDNVQTGGRVSTTVGRVDASVSAYRGTEAFGALSLTPTGLVEQYSRFTMVATDAEAVVGSWALRAEAAYFSDRKLAGARGPVPGRAIDAGVGIDRSAGDYHLFASVVWHRDWATTGPAPTVLDVPDRVQSEILEYADPLGPWGARGMAEMPYLPFTAAVVAAVHSATGIWFSEFPLTPERILRGLGKIA